MSHRISAIVPTIGRADSLAALLDALVRQTRRPDDVVIADGSVDHQVRGIVEDPRWTAAGLEVRYVHVTPPNAVRQRQAAIARATGSLLLFLDDDVVPEPECVAALEGCLRERDAVAVVSAFSNQAWPVPTTLWRWYMRLINGVRGREWQGRVIGPLLRFGYNPLPASPAPMEWISTSNSLVRRDAYDRAGGFSSFFLHRSTMNEDLDLGLKLRREGSILLCPAARLAHMFAPGGRVSVRAVAEDDAYNRYAILRHTLGRSRISAAWLVTVFVAVETASGIAVLLRHLRADGLLDRLAGRLSALARIALAPDLKS